MPRQIDAEDLQKISEIVAAANSAANGHEANLSSTSKIHIQVGQILAVIIPLMFGTWICAGLYFNLMADVNKLKKEKWTFGMEKAKIREFQLLNPTIRVPDVKKIHDDDGD